MVLYIKQKGYEKMKEETCLDRNYTYMYNVTQYSAEYHSSHGIEMVLYFLHFFK